MDDQNKNLILAMVLSLLVIGTWTLLFPPEPVAPPAEPAVAQTEAGIVPPAADSEAATPDTQDLAEAEEVGRVEIDTPPALSGTISLLGGRFDDLSLKGYREDLSEDSPPIVTLLRAQGQPPQAYYALYGWVPGGQTAAEDVPGQNTIWTVETGEILTPDSPVTLMWDNGNGMTFRRTISVDDKFLFTISQSVENTGDTAQRMAPPYGVLARHGQPADLKGFFILHEGIIRQGDTELEEMDYDDAADLAYDDREGGARADILTVEENGWIGFTDHYWMTTLIPAPPGQQFNAAVRYSEQRDQYQTQIRLPTIDLAAGESAEVTTQLFAGAKEWEAIRTYQNEGGIHRFLDSIDWGGWFFFLTKPIFAVLHWLNA